VTPIVISIGTSHPWNVAGTGRDLVVGADRGVRRVIEQRFTPITRRLGWRLEFPWARYARWAEHRESVHVIEHTPLAPFGHFSLIRFAKAKSEPVAQAAQEPELQLEAQATA